MKKITDETFGFLSKTPNIFFITGFWLVLNILTSPLIMKLRALSGTMVPDLTPMLNTQALTNIFTSYGVQGMTIYKTFEFYDNFFIISYAILFSSVIYLLFKKTKFKHLAWIPVIAGLLDYTENYFLAKIIADVSNISKSIASIAGTIITVKILLIGITMLLIIIGLIRKFALKRRKTVNIHQEDEGRKVRRNAL